jgi:metal-sulfur cluster biosynthetic enzyme
MTLSKDTIISALKECYDPEIPISIVDLGLIYDVQIREDWVGIRMTLTSPGCPASSMISQNVRNRVLQIPEVRDAEVTIVWEPEWTPARMSPEAKTKLKWTG